MYPLTDRNQSRVKIKNYKVLTSGHFGAREIKSDRVKAKQKAFKYEIFMNISILYIDID